MSNSSEAGPSGRSASTEGGHAPPIQQFDANLRLLSDSYLGFFLERKRIEEQYVESLQKLHKKSKTTDTWLDERYDPSIGKNTARTAWSEVRDNVEREAETRLAFIGSLTSEVINPLMSLKDTQDRIRKRIREDLKEAIGAHSDYAENVFPKLKRAYMKKSQDVEEFRNAAAAAPPLSPTAVHEVNPLSFPRQSREGRPVVTSPQPLKPLDRRPSTNHGGQRNRSPSSGSTALQDLAQHGKKQLNQLMTFLDKGGNLKEANRSDNALRGVRAKREAEEADKEYRKAVHWLETLRLRRVKILEGGYNSLEAFVTELSQTVKGVLIKYSDNLMATARTQAQMSDYTRAFVDKINPEKDTTLVTVNIPRLLALATPKPLYYDNFAVGECRDLIFGVSLVDYATAKGLADGEIPKIVRICIREIDQRGLEAEGIYRVSGRHASVQELQHKIERNEEVFDFQTPQDDVYAVSSLLKLYLRELPEPVFRFPLQDRMQHTEEIAGHISSNFRLLRSKMRRLPPVHQATLKAIVEHLAKVASHSEKNKMDPKNLAIVFGSVIFGEDEMPKGGDLLSVQTWKDTLMEDLISHAHVLFQTSSSPPLPPAPAGEPVPPLTYGSAYTKVSEIPPPLPPRSPSPRMRRSLDHSGPPSSHGSVSNGRSVHVPEDFTPQLPPRPANSIHPSLRAGPMANPSRQSMPPPPLPVRSAQIFDDDVSFAHLSPVIQSREIPSVPPSPSRPAIKVPPSPLLPKSPWSESQPSLASGPSTEEINIQDATPAASTDEPSTSAPSSVGGFASPVSPTSSSGGWSVVSPPTSTKPLPPAQAPSATSVATLNANALVTTATPTPAPAPAPALAPASVAQTPVPAPSAASVPPAPSQIQSPTENQGQGQSQHTKGASASSQ